MTRPHLAKAHLEEAFLFRTNLERADLFGANLEKAILWEAKLEGALLVLAHLEGADLQGTPEGEDPPGFRFAGISIPAGVQWEEGPPRETVGLAQEDIAEAIGDENTKLPSHLKPPTYWGVKTDEQSEEP
jgi:uncharacterized protein YjbI with pentapeptide repeats